MSDELLDQLVISVEHGVLCIRTKEQKLLWGKKIEAFPPEGVSFEELKKELRNQIHGNGPGKDKVA